VQPDAQLAREAAKVGQCRIGVFCAHRGEQPGAIELHDVGHLGRLNVGGAAASRLTDEVGGLDHVRVDVTPGAHLHEADAKRFRCVRHWGNEPLLAAIYGAAGVER
jgi:hypothetical protein